MFNDTMSGKVMMPPANDNQIDPFLLTALNNPRDRLTVLKLDYELERFVRDPKMTRLEFPPMTSYQRLIVHRVAQYFKLEHTVVEVDAAKGTRAVVLYKTVDSRIPVLRFTDLREQPETSTRTVQIMKRNEPDAPYGMLRRSDSEGGSYMMDPRGPTILSRDRTLEEREAEYAKARARIFSDNTSKSMEDREAEYAKARARIFNESQSNSPTHTPSPQQSSSSPSSPRSEQQQSKDALSSSDSSLKTHRYSAQPTDDQQTAEEDGLGYEDEEYDDLPRDDPSYTQQRPSFWTRGGPPQYENYYDDYDNPPYNTAPSQGWSKSPPPQSNQQPGGYQPTYQPNYPARGTRTNPVSPPPTSNGNSTVKMTNNGPSPVNQNPGTAPDYGVGGGMRPGPGPWNNPHSYLQKQPNTAQKPQHPPFGPNGPYRGYGDVYYPQTGPEQWPPFYGPGPGPFPPPHMRPPMQPNGDYTGPFPPFMPGPGYPMHPEFHPQHMAPMPAPLPVYDYDRRPPKSAELFDPKAPTAPSKRNSAPPYTLEGGMANMNLGGGRGAPMTDPAQKRVVIKNPQQRPPGNKSLMYDYSVSQPYQQAYMQPNPVLQPAHILEVCKLPEGIKPYEADTLLSDVKKCGATIKWLDSSTVIAIFKTSNAAKEALQTITSPMFQLRPWVAPVANTPGAQFAREQVGDGNDPWNE